MVDALRSVFDKRNSEICFLEPLQQKVDGGASENPVRVEPEEDQAAGDEVNETAAEQISSDDIADVATVTSPGRDENQSQSQPPCLADDIGVLWKYDDGRAGVSAGAVAKVVG